MFSPSRRQFLAASSFVLGESIFGGRSRKAHSLLLSEKIGYSPLAPSAILPEPIVPATLRSLATQAIDASLSAGASYADIRLGERQHYKIGLDYNGLTPVIEMEAGFSFGLRVLVDGAWRFVHGTAPSVDAMVSAARNAVVTARSYSQFTNQRSELAPAPIVKGEWVTPIQIDPFTIPLEDQTALLTAYVAATGRVRYGSPELGSWRSKIQAWSWFWTKRTRVFASSEGSLTTQATWHSESFLGGAGNRGMGLVQLQVPRGQAVSGGYETVATPGMQDALKEVTEEAVKLAALPRGTLDVGRYPVVFDGITLGATLGNTIGPALELDRVLGNEADAAGTSYLAPPEQMLGTMISSPALSVTGHRSMPSMSAVKWDDEGVATNPFPLLSEGRLVNYSTSRLTAPELRSFYEKNGIPLASNGCAVAPEPDNPVLIRAPHMVVKPAAHTSSLEDLYKDVKRGLLIREVAYIMTDHQLTSVDIPFYEGLGILAFEIANGKLVRRIYGNGLQFDARKLWRGLAAVGDTSTVRDNTIDVWKGQPWVSTTSSTTAPAGLFKEVNVYSMKNRI